ncbi:hypothetical protein BH09SUM1_BH09SUM1_10240 [soil metagenome]
MPMIKKLICFLALTASVSAAQGENFPDFVNGSFDFGLNGWTSQGTAGYTATGTDTGNHFGYSRADGSDVGGVKNSLFFQSVTLPDSGFVLKYMAKTAITSTGGSGGIAHVIININGADHGGGVAINHGWKQYQLDLAQDSDTSVTVKFTAEAKIVPQKILIPTFYQAYIYVDQVKILRNRWKGVPYNFINPEFNNPLSDGWAVDPSAIAPAFARIELGRAVIGDATGGSTASPVLSQGVRLDTTQNNSLRFNFDPTQLNDVHSQVKVIFRDLTGDPLGGYNINNYGLETFNLISETQNRAFSPVSARRVRIPLDQAHNTKVTNWNLVGGVTVEASYTPNGHAGSFAIDAFDVGPTTLADIYPDDLDEGSFEYVNYPWTLIGSGRAADPTTTATVNTVLRAPAGTSSTNINTATRYLSLPNAHESIAFRIYQRLSERTAADRGGFFLTLFDASDAQLFQTTVTSDSAIVSGDPASASVIHFSTDQWNEVRISIPDTAPNFAQAAYAKLQLKSEHPLDDATGATDGYLLIDDLRLLDSAAEETGWAVR